MPSYHLRLEVMNFKWIVEDTLDLSTIRGGGLLALYAPDLLRKQAAALGLTNLVDVSLGASIAWFLFDAESPEAAQAARAATENYFATHPTYRYLTIVFDILPVSDNFTRDREALIALNRFHQLQSPTLAWPVQDEAWVCNKDGLRPASAPQGTSQSVQVRHDFGGVEKQKFYGKITGLLNLPDFAWHLDELTHDESQGNLHHKMAVVYLDGNRFSTFQRELCPTITLQQGWDTCLRDNRKTLLRTLLEAPNGPRTWLSPRHRIRLETLTWGGDDIAWVVPAWQGWWLLNFFFQHSQNWQFTGVNEIGESETRPLTHSAGVVFCHHNASIHDAKHLAKKLCDHAKVQHPLTNCVAYQVLESFDHIGAELEEHRVRSAPPINRNMALQQLVLPAAPLAALSPTLSKMHKHLPRKKLHSLVFGLFRPGNATPDELEELRKGLRDSLAPSDWLILEAAFGQGDMLFCHLNELWDYAI